MTVEKMTEHQEVSVMFGRRFQNSLSYVMILRALNQICESLIMGEVKHKLL